MTTLETLQQRIRESGDLVTRLEVCRSKIGMMCKDGRPPKMSIPVSQYDEDIYISTTIADAIAALKATSAEKD